MSKMLITKVEKNDSQIYVTGNTEIGNIKGEWIFSEEPVLGEYYSFELIWGEGNIDRKCIHLIQNKNFSPNVCIDNDIVIFRGRCETIDEDEEDENRAYFVRFYDDWLELMGIKDDDYSIQEGDNILFSMKFDEVEIYPY